MTWTRTPASRRSASLPPDWAQRRRAVLERDEYRCQIAGPRCTYLAREVDHVGQRTDHRLEALRAVCGPCHAERSARQGAAARGAQTRRRWHRAPEPVPGYLEVTR